MKEYIIEHEPLHYDNAFRVLRLKRRGTILAQLKYKPNVIHNISGKPDKEFTRQTKRSPAMELLMHAASHSRRNADGSVTLRYTTLFPDAVRLLARLRREGRIAEHETAITVKKISTVIPPVEIK